MSNQSNTGRTDFRDAAISPPSETVPLRSEKRGCRKCNGIDFHTENCNLIGAHGYSKITVSDSERSPERHESIRSIYLAARYSRTPQMRELRDELTRRGYRVISRWIDGGHELTKEGSTHAAHRERQRFATEDWADLMDADTVVSFTEEPRKTNTRGGRHVEFGGALATGKRLVVVGWRENVFHCLPQVEFYDNSQDWLRGLGQVSDAGRIGGEPSLLPASEMIDRELVELALESYARALMYPRSITQHDRANECRDELLKRLSNSSQPQPERVCPECEHSEGLKSVDDGSCTFVLGSDRAGGFLLCGCTFPAPAETCTWKEDADGYWKTTCGQDFVVNSDTPSGNGMLFCFHCGKRLEEVEYPL